MRVLWNICPMHAGVHDQCTGGSDFCVSGHIGNQCEHRFPTSWKIWRLTHTLAHQRANAQLGHCYHSTEPVVCLYVCMYKTLLYYNTCTLFECISTITTVVNHQCGWRLVGSSSVCPGCLDWGPWCPEALTQSALKVITFIHSLHCILKCPRFRMGLLARIGAHQKCFINDDESGLDL